MSVADVLRETERAAHLRALRLVLLGKLPLELVEELYAPRPSRSYLARVDAALRLARDVETCRDLLRGEPVDESALDPAGLAWAGERRLVRLERPLDLFELEGQRAA